MEYLTLFVVEYDAQKVLLHLVYTVLKSMVDLDELVIVIMAVTNHQGLGIPSLQILKSKSKLTQNTLWEVKLLIFLLFSLLVLGAVSRQCSTQNAITPTSNL